MERACCFTGHRNIPEKDYSKIKKRLEGEIENLIRQGVVYFGNGGALGFDTLAALTVLAFREKYPQIKLIMVLPCWDQDKKWSEQDKEVYASILEKADKNVYTSEQYHRGCMFVRNRHLVACSSYCIAYLKENTGGTAYTVRYALEHGVEVINIAENIRGADKKNKYI